MRHRLSVIGIFVAALASASPTGAQQTIAGERLQVVGEAKIGGDVGHQDYVSQLTKWLISREGAADFRYLFTDELHAKSFIADLEQALAGGQIISKSVAVLASNFTNPAAGVAETLTVKDLPSAENMAVFESGDTIRVRTFSRASGSLTIADSYGVVTAYTDQPGGVQTWTFTRNTGADAGSMTAGTVIQADAIVLDYGVSGNGFHEVNAIDGLYGQNSPYSQVVTWATSPIQGNLTVRSRIGNLRGITGNANEYGIIAGTYAATNGQYFRASNLGFEIHGINLQLWDGATNVFKIDRTVPSLAMGSPLPSSFTTGTGCWQGKDGSVYKWRCGNPSGDRIEWNGTTLNVVGNITVTGGGGTSWNDLTDRPVELTDGRVSAALASNGRLLNTVVAAPSGSGLFLGSDKMGFYSGGAWQTYMDNAGNFYLGGTSGALQWNGSTLAITGSVTATSGVIGGWTIGASTLTGGDASLASSGNLTLGTGNSVVRLSADNATYRLWVGNATAGSAPFRVEQDGDVRVGDLRSDNGDIILDNNGVTISTGTAFGFRFGGSTNGVYYDSVDGEIILRTSNMDYFFDQTGGFYPESSVNLGDTGGNRWATIYGVALNITESIFWSSPPTTTSGDNPMVYSTANEQIYEKTDGFSGTCSNPTSIVIESGIVTGCS